MQAAIMAHDAIAAGSHDVMIAGGMESMSNAPYLLPKVRDGLRLGHNEVKDHMFLDGLEDAYESGRLMGAFAEDAAQAYQFTREVQDDYAIESLRRAKSAIGSGAFDEEIVSVVIATKKIEEYVDTDEQPPKANVEKIRKLRPAFAKEGSVTAANSSSISDGAAALVMMRRSEAEAKGLAPLAIIHGHATHARKPAHFTSAPVGAIQNLFEKTGWSCNDVDLFEVNEAFAVVPMIAMKELDLPYDKLNVNGGACALGHPIGASGARIMVTLLAALKHQGSDKGVASLCIGGGEATAIAIERCH
jgi:acetyl-CoA C-acetyltransferase